MRGKPVLGVISGLLFGFFLSLALQQWSVYPLTPLSVIGLPILGLVVGLLLAAWAPFGRGRSRAGTPVEDLHETSDTDHDEPDTARNADSNGGGGNGGDGD